MRDALDEIVRGGTRLLELLRPFRERVALATTLNAATTGAGIGLMGTSAWLISTAALAPSIAALQVAIVGVRVFGLSRGAFRYGERLISHDLTLRLLAKLRAGVYRAVERWPAAQLLDTRSGDLLARFIGDVETLEHVYVRVVGPMLGAIAIGLLVLLVLGAHGAGPGLLGLGGLLVAGLIVPVVASRVGADATRRTVALRALLHERAVDVIEGAADIVGASRGHAFASDLQGLCDDVARAETRAARGAASGVALGLLVSELTTVAVLASAIPLVRAGSLDGVDLAVVALVALAAFEAVSPLPAAWQGLWAALPAAERVFGLSTGSGAVPGRADAVPSTPAPAGRLLALRDIGFTYPGQATRAVDGVELHVAPGRIVAVVGSSGSGKSTLANLVLRFWDPDEGSIEIDGRDVRELDVDAVRARIAVVTQRPFLFTGTIRDNIRLGRATASEDDMRRAVRDAGLDALVAGLPDRLDTWIGAQGLALSGGERQRVALARAFLKDSPLLVLDEPTAHLDALSESALLGRLDAMRSRCGVLLLTHRLTGLDVADEILVLGAGRIVQRGAFGELVRSPGWFSRMLELQRSADVFDPQRGPWPEVLTALPREADGGTRLAKR